MKVSGTGALVGGAVGGLARGAVVLFHLGTASFVLALPSAAMGALVGAIAGASGRPARGAAIGAVLSGLAFELFELSCASLSGAVALLLGDPNAPTDFMTGLFPTALQMALAGAIAGGAGGAVGSWTGFSAENEAVREARGPKAIPQQAEHEASKGESQR
jgi:hypothetical protein